MRWFSRIFRRAETRSTAADSIRPSPGNRPGGSPIERLTTLHFERLVRARPRVVVDVWAPWCGPCRAFAPIFASAASEWREQAGFGEIHADHERTLVSRFGVRSIPSLLFFRDGELVRTLVGVVSSDRLAKQLLKTFRDLP